MIIDSLIRQLESAVKDDCHKAIAYLHSAAAELREKIDTIYSKL